MFLEFDFGAEVSKETLAHCFSFVEVAAVHGIKRDGFLFWQLQIQEPVDFGDGIAADGIKGPQLSDPTKTLPICEVFENGKSHFFSNGLFE